MRIEQFVKDVLTVRCNACGSYSGDPCTNLHERDPSPDANVERSHFAGLHTRRIHDSNKWAQGSELVDTPWKYATCPTCGISDMNSCAYVFGGNPSRIVHHARLLVAIGDDSAYY